MNKYLCSSLLTLAGASVLLSSHCLGNEATDQALYNSSSVEEVKKHIKAGGDVNAVFSAAGTTLLMRITYAGINPDTVAAMVKELVKAGASVNAQSKYAKDGKVYGAMEPEGMTALMHACESYYEGDDFISGGNAYPQVVKALLDAGADPNLKNVHDYTALLYALITGNPESVKLLLAAGAKHDEKLEGGVNYLMSISAYPHAKRTLPMIPLLLEAGLDINAQDDHGGTALHHCSAELEDAENEYLWENRALCAAALIKAGAKTDIKDKEGNTPLDLAKKSLPHSQKLLTALQAK